MQQPFYDHTKSYEDNYEKGPFGSFGKKSSFKQEGLPKFPFLGKLLYSPFGIPSGPLVNSGFVKSAFSYGFDVCTYKTVRSDLFPSHTFPNVVLVDFKGELHPDKTSSVMVRELPVDKIDELSITNSFGVPSKAPDIWQVDMKKAVSYQGKGQLLIGSFMGTVKRGQTQKDFINDFALSAKLANETGVEALEVNLSCPNIGNEGLVCYDMNISKHICKAIRKVIGNTPLILKVGYYRNDSDIETIMEIAHEYANAIAAINSLQVAIVGKDGKQALPGGKDREKSGVCGAAIRWAGFEMVEKFSAVRFAKGYDTEIVGIGGVMTPKDFFAYRSKGADVVQSATGSMWNPLLAQDIKAQLVAA